MIQDCLRRGIMPSVIPQMVGGAPFPTAFEPLPTKSVLQNDFLTAKQMSASSVSMPATASAYSSALDKDKGGKASPHPRNPLISTGMITST